MREADFQSGHYDTGYIEAHKASLLALYAPSDADGHRAGGCRHRRCREQAADRWRRRPDWRQPHRAPAWRAFARLLLAGDDERVWRRL